MAQVDLVIRGGEIVTSTNTIKADIGIANGKIVQIGGELSAENEINAEGKLVLPGGIDAHVHLNSQLADTPKPAWVDDFTSGSKAALAGGITTIGNMTFSKPGETPLAAFERERKAASTQTIADYFLHSVVMEVTEEMLRDISKLKSEGCRSLKIFTPTPRFDPQVSQFLELIRKAGENDLISIIHCEDFAILQDATTQLSLSGRTSLRYFSESRPVLAEVVATQRAVAFAEATNSPVYIVHLSSRRALEVCAEAKSRNIPVFVETRPLYLHLTQELLAEAEGPKYVGQPPLREQTDVEALWEGLKNGVVSTVCTDHAPWLLKDKLDISLDINNLRPGVENLETMIPMLYSEGVLKRGLSHQRFVELISTNAAKIFGLYPKKGTIEVGSDADIVIFDPKLKHFVEGASLKSNSDYSVYEGWEVTGKPITTIRRGEVVYQEGKVTGTAGSGIYQEAHSPVLP